MENNKKKNTNKLVIQCKENIKEYKLYILYI